MSLIRKMVGVVVLTLALGVVGLAGETQAPPCAPPDPGQMPTVPCASSQPATNDSNLPSQTNTPLGANTFVLGSVIAEIATSFVLF